MRFLKPIKLITTSILFLLCACSSNSQTVVEEKDPLYTISIGKDSITVGESSFEDSKEFLKMTSEFHTKLINDILTVSSITIYADDIKGKIRIDDEKLDKRLGIEKTCYLYNGEYIEKNGHVCIVSKQVNDHLNTISFYGDILNDDVDKIDHIIVEYN